PATPGRLWVLQLIPSPGRRSFKGPDGSRSRGRAGTAEKSGRRSSVTSGAWNDSIPGIGTFFVGIDVAAGRYRCEDGTGGWWVRFTGPGGGVPVGSWPRPPGPTEIEIAQTDFAFETHVSTYWRRIAPPTAPGDGTPAEPRPVADPALRAELDTIVA